MDFSEENIQQQVINMVAQVMELGDVTGLCGATRLQADAGFKSEHYFELLMLLEEGFPGLVLDPVFLHGEDFVTVATITRFLKRQFEAESELQV